jgi:uncharacterized protein YeaO (DUF488 family)
MDGQVAGFRLRYTAELGMPSSRAALGRLRTLAAAGPLTLVTATADAKRSHAAVLAGLLASEAAAAGKQVTRPAGRISSALIAVP